MKTQKKNRIASIIIFLLIIVNALFILKTYKDFNYLSLKSNEVDEKMVTINELIEADNDIDTRIDEFNHITSEYINTIRIKSSHLNLEYSFGFLSNIILLVIYMILKRGDD